MEKVCFQQFTETFPATLNFRNCIFPAYHRKGSHFRYEPGIFQKNLIWAQSRVYISSSCKATQICNCTSLVAVVGILRSCWQRGKAIPQCDSVNFETWFYQVNVKWFQNNFRGISDIVLGSSLRNMSTIERPQNFWAAALLARHTASIYCRPSTQPSLQRKWRCHEIHEITSRNKNFCMLQPFPAGAWKMAHEKSGLALNLTHM